MTDNDVKQVTLTLNTAQAEQKLNAITQRLEEARQKKTQAFEQGNAKAYTLYAQEAKKLEQQQQRLISRTQTVTRTLQSLDKATPRDLRTAITQINRQLNSGNIERGSKEWNTLTRSMAEAKAELAKINEEQRAAEKSVADSAASWGEKWSGFVVTIQGVKSAIDSVITSISKYVDEYAQMQEHTSSVTKYTGLAKEEVDKLNESFQRMDTATPRAKLNDLAADAGRLGIQSRQSVQEFVEAADQINVALGEDLGEDAVKNIGKLAQMFGESDKLGLKKAMLSTASTINELAQSSSASEGYIMEFTSRLAGVGNQAGLTQAQIMGFASVLDQNMVGVERGATALQNVLTALFAKPQKMAQAAGLEVTQFTQLLKTDANAALQQFLQALQQKGGMDQLAPIFKEMNMSGSGVTQTLSTLAAKLSDVQAAQQQANDAYRQGTSCTNEAAIANSTVQAQLDIAQQKWANLRIELGERLTPIYLTTTNAALTLVQKLRELKSVVTTVTKFVADNRKEIIATAVGLATFTLAVKAHTIATRAAALVQAIQTAAVAAYQAVVITCTAAQTALNAAIKSNGFTAVISLILSAAAALVTYLLMSDKTTESTKQLTRAQDQATQAQQRRAQAQKALSDVQAQAATSAAEEKARITSLTTLIHDNTASIQARRAAIAKLQQVIPSYHASISETGTLMEKNKASIDDYITSLDKLALAEAIFDKIKENLKEQIDIDMAIDAWNKAIARRQAIMQQEGHESDEHTIMMNGKLVTVERNSKRRYDNQMLSIDQQKYQYYVDRSKANQEVNAALHKLAKDRGVDTLVNNMIAQGTATTPKPTSPAATTHTGETEAQRKARIKREKQQAKEEAERLRKQKEANKAAEKEYDRAAATLRQKAIADYASGATDLIKYRETLQAIEENTAQAKRDIYAQDTEEWKSHNDELLRIQQQHDRKSQDWSIEDLNRKEKAELQQAAIDNAKGLTTEEAYQEQRNRITVDYLQRRMNLYKEYGRAEDFERTREQLTDTLNTQKLEKQKSYMEKLNTLRQEYEQKSAAERMQIELQMLQAVYQATDETGKRISTMTEEEYNRLKKLINLKYLGPDGKVNTDGTITPGTTGEAHDDLQSKADKALSQARSTKSQEIKPVDTATDWGFSSITSAAYKLSAQKETYDNLKKMRADDLIDEQTYQEACTKLDQERFTNLTALAEAAYSSIGAIMSSASSLFTANQQLEETRVTKRYDAEIKAAGSTTKKGKKLEEQKQKELAQIKTKYNKKQMKIELAQAVATTAMNALKAYGAMADIPVVGPALGAIAAAAAIAAGAIQIASIKKQHAAEQEGYYSGGYTGGHNYRQSAGIVHQGEFVANHQAVRNPAIRPVLDLIDTAQRTNRIATLTPADVSRAILAPQATAAATSATAAAATQTAAATTQTAATAPHTTQIITTTTQAQTDTLRRLADQLDQGIRATVTIDGPDGLDRQYRKYQRLNNI